MLVLKLFLLRTEGFSKCGAFLLSEFIFEMSTLSNGNAATVLCEAARILHLRDLSLS